ncbi:lectin%2C galactoside-binding, soluble, 2a [Xyrichtys novacula]|uniref:Galectin n=1 Tax=Xyrichtys novacula TaxID=13765 RepID=A0AAV1GUN1_XYRNO|nr:lectin%2C galactoside-binding, soluble, 2a [Xyrichtys novacula]
MSLGLQDTPLLLIFPGWGEAGPRSPSAPPQLTPQTSKDMFDNEGAVEVFTSTLQSPHDPEEETPPGLDVCLERRHLQSVRQQDREDAAEFRVSGFALRVFFTQSLVQYLLKIFWGMIVKNMSFKVGQTLTLGGVTKPDATNFAINIGPDEQDITMHINPRFNAHGDENAVVCNSYQGGNWCEEHREGGFPFQLGAEFKLVIEFTPAEFVVTLSDGSIIHFPNRMGLEKYSFISVDGEARITSLEIK